MLLIPMLVGNDVINNDKNHDHFAILSDIVVFAQVVEFCYTKFC